MTDSIFLIIKPHCIVRKPKNGLSSSNRRTYLLSSSPALICTLLWYNTTQTCRTIIFIFKLGLSSISNLRDESELRPCFQFMCIFSLNIFSCERALEVLMSVCQSSSWNFISFQAFRFREGSGKVQGRFKEDSGKIQGRFREDSGKIQERFREDSGKIHGRFREGSRNIPEDSGKV